MVENIRVDFQPMQIRKRSRKLMILFEADIGSAFCFLSCLIIDTDPTT